MATASKHKMEAAAGAAAAGGALAAGKLVRDRVAQRSERRARVYRLRPEEGAPEGVRRIARGQIDLAREELTGQGKSDVGEAVHEARKAFKRVRALLRLARDELADDVYRRENETFRDAGRALSGVRDAAVLVETLDDIRTRYAGELPDGAFGGLRDALDEEARAAHDALEDDRTAIEGVAGTLDAARARVAGWRVAEGATLAPGFKRIYRRGRRALRAAGEDGSTESLHELRKRAKDLWHAAQVLQRAVPGKLRRGAHDLSDAVGDDHDLAVLLDAVRQRPQALAPGERELLVSLVGRRRAELQRTALERGRKLYARKPRAMAKVVRRAPAR
jgi:CHAD domain-containing protein